MSNIKAAEVAKKAILKRIASKLAAVKENTVRANHSNHVSHGNRCH